MLAMFQAVARQRFPVVIVASFAGRHSAQLRQLRQVPASTTSLDSGHGIEVLPAELAAKMWLNTQRQVRIATHCIRPASIAPDLRRITDCMRPTRGRYSRTGSPG
jgi:hypothetical protein